MADPVSQTVLFVASAGAKAAGKLTSGLNDATASRANAGIDEMNAVMASQQASAREDQVRRQGRQTIGEQIAMAAQNGGGVFTGSAADALQGSYVNLAMDALNTRYQGIVQTTNALNDAAKLRAKARTQTQGAFLSAATSMLQSASSYSGGGEG